MAATLRELRGRIRSAGSIKKITKAQELIATSRIAKAQARVEAARPYSSDIQPCACPARSASGQCMTMRPRRWLRICRRAASTMAWASSPLNRASPTPSTDAA